MKIDKWLSKPKPLYPYLIFEAKLTIYLPIFHQNLCQRITFTYWIKLNNNRSITDKFIGYSDHDFCPRSFYFGDSGGVDLLLVLWLSSMIIRFGFTPTKDKRGWNITGSWQELSHYTLPATLPCKSSVMAVRNGGEITMDIPLHSPLIVCSACFFFSMILVSFPFPCRLYRMAARSDAGVASLSDIVGRNWDEEIGLYDKKF